ncbi:3143_t:CDS:2 [Diversispora eburnea]|uniref:3143_t:CDS:1 n=1 Tax=Diversispora eburnea TaxID=1213867 RepID=A0A9N9A6G4_9GLOM|nr:3143_t:CDS:2 [Diversispora eburnea]
MPIKSNSSIVENGTIRKMIEGQTSRSDSMMEEFESIFGNLSPLKRKREDEINGPKNKSQKISKCLSIKLAKNMDIVITDQQHATMTTTATTTYESQRIQLLHHILSDPLPSDENHLNYWNNVTVTLSDWIELQAQKKNMSLLEFQFQFHERFCQMELSLVKLHNNIPKVYDEIRCSVDMFLLNADWLRYMKAMVSSEYSQSGDVCLVIQKAKELLEFKKSLYGEILQQNGLTWRRLGFPVSDSWFSTTKQWLHGLAFHCLSIMNNELNKFEPTNIDDTLELIGTSNNKFTLTSLILATSYVEWGLSQIDRMENKVRCVEIRMMHIFEKFSAALVEAGLRLCEHITKPKINTVTGPNNFVYMYSEFVVKFVNRALEYSGLEEIAELRMRPLLARLIHMWKSNKEFEKYFSNTVLHSEQ